MAEFFAYVKFMVMALGACAAVVILFLLMATGWMLYWMRKGKG